MLSLKTSFALANHIREGRVFLHIGSDVGSLSSGPWLLKTPIVHFPQMHSPLVPAPAEGECLTFTDTFWNGQASSSSAWTCTCDHDRKIKISPS